MEFLSIIGTALTGGVTGIIGALLGKVFSFVDMWAEQKKAAAEHERTIELLKLQNQIGKEETERELAIAESKLAGDLRVASYGHDTGVGVSYPWVAATIRLVRPVLTFTLIVLVGVIYLDSGVDARIELQASVIYMCSSAVLWFFGDRTMRVGRNT